MTNRSPYVGHRGADPHQPFVRPGSLKFGPAVWKKLTAEEEKDVKDMANQSPPNEQDLSQGLYQPVYDILATGPYDVPDPIRPTFALMKVTEVVHWVIETYGAYS